jgi:hypothetical protein
LILPAIGGYGIFASITGLKERAAFQMVLKRRPHYVADNRRARSKHPSIHGGYRFRIIGFAVQSAF